MKPFDANFFWLQVISPKVTFPTKSFLLDGSMNESPNEMPLLEGGATCPEKGKNILSFNMIAFGTKTV